MWWEGEWPTFKVVKHRDKFNFETKNNNNIKMVKKQVNDAWGGGSEEDEKQHSKWKVSKHAENIKNSKLNGNTFFHT